MCSVWQGGRVRNHEYNFWNDLSVVEDSKQTGIRTVDLEELFQCGGPMCAGSVEIEIEGGLLEPGVDHPCHVDTNHCKRISGGKGESGRRERGGGRGERERVGGWRGEEGEKEREGRGIGRSLRVYLFMLGGALVHEVCVSCQLTGTVGGESVTAPSEPSLCVQWQNSYIPQVKELW